MNSRTVLALVAAVLLLGIVLFFARRSYHAKEAALPPREEFATLEAASRAALAYVTAHGGSYVPIAGTGSMAPYIPPGKTTTLEEQKKELVAFVITAGDKTFADITKGALVIYRPAWNDGRPVMHQAAQFDHGGWIMSGLHNRNSETTERMTADKFTGLVAYAAVLRADAR